MLATKPTRKCTTGTTVLRYRVILIRSSGFDSFRNCDEGGGARDGFAELLHKSSAAFDFFFRHDMSP